MKTLQEGLLDVEDNIRAYGTMVNLYDVIKDHIVKMMDGRGFSHIFDTKACNAFIKKTGVKTLDTVSGKLKSSAKKEFVRLCSAIFKNINFIPSLTDEIGRIPGDYSFDLLKHKDGNREINPDFGIFIDGNKIKTVCKYNGEIDASFVALNPGMIFVLDKNFEELL